MIGDWIFWDASIIVVDFSMMWFYDRWLLADLNVIDIADAVGIVVDDIHANLLGTNLMFLSTNMLVYPDGRLSNKLERKKIC